MKKMQCTCLWLAAASVTWADTTTIPFQQPADFPVALRLALPKEDAVLVSHAFAKGVDTIVARLDDNEKEGLAVEAVDADGKRIWHYDFGYNLSAAPGCAVSASFHPSNKALILSYHGYKWDWHCKLLFLEKKGDAFELREYSVEAPDILSYIKKHPGYSSKHTYSIQPVKFDGSRIIFSCIPGEPPESNLPHPLAQDMRWFDVTAELEDDFKITPIEIKISH